MAQADEDALPGPGPAVRIRVAIQEAEDAAEPQDDAGTGVRGAGDPARYLSPGWGSASEDEPSRGLSAPSSENERDELEQEWKPPDQELIRKLVEQIEFYFSDENLEKDAFLLKHVRRNKLGYVSVKLLTSFKKVKHLTRDWRITAHALRYSGTLELNEDQRKVRRTTPVPLFPNENLPSKMLLLYDLYLSPALWALAAPQNGRLQERVMEHLLQQFGTFGGIASVRILRPGRELPPDIRRLGGRYSQVGTQDCAIVEFEEVEAAVRAHEFMVAESQGKDSMKAVLIGLKPPKKKPARDRPQDEEPAASVRLCKSPHRRVEELQYLGDESSANSSSEPESDPTSPMAGRRLALCNKLAPNAGAHGLFLSPSTSPCSSPWSSPLAQRKGVPRKSPLAGEGSPEAPCKCTDYSSDSSVTPSGSPWVRRRRQAELGTPEKSPRASPLLARKVQTADRLPVGVLRWPRGPDDTRGFHGGHERNRAHV